MPLIMNLVFVLCVCVRVCLCMGLQVCGRKVEASQMAPKGFSLIVPSSGIRPLGLVASTAFEVTTKSNHFHHSGLVGPDSQKTNKKNQRGNYRVNITHTHTQTFTYVEINKIQDKYMSNCSFRIYQNNFSNSLLVFFLNLI